MSQPSRESRSDRFRLASLAAASALLLTGAFGCAGGSRCQIIPAQLELAEMSRDKARTAYLSLKDDVDRMQSNNEVSLEREASLTKERDELKALVDSIGVGREQKEAK